MSPVSDLFSCCLYLTTRTPCIKSHVLWLYGWSQKFMCEWTCTLWQQGYSRELSAFVCLSISCNALHTRKPETPCVLPSIALWHWKAEMCTWGLLFKSGQYRLIITMNEPQTACTDTTSPHNQSVPPLAHFPSWEAAIATGWDTAAPSCCSCGCRADGSGTRGRACGSRDGSAHWLQARRNLRATRATRATKLRSAGSKTLFLFVSPKGLRSGKVSFPSFSWQCFWYLLVRKSTLLMGPKGSPNSFPAKNMNERRIKSIVWAQWMKRAWTSLQHQVFE